VAKGTKVLQEYEFDLFQKLESVVDMRGASGLVFGALSHPPYLDMLRAFCTQELMRWNKL
jgi:hypothetical protein